MSEKGYICRCCGEFHDELPMSYGSSALNYFYYYFSYFEWWGCQRNELLS